MMVFVFLSAHNHRHQIPIFRPMNTSTMEMPTACFFQGCENPVGDNAWRCDFHRGRERCSIPDCRRQAYARKLCARHGGKRQCMVDGCAFRVRSNNLCAKHGEKRMKKPCVEEGCAKPAHLNQRCVKHGGGRLCKMDGCKTFARSGGGYCCRHNRIMNEMELVAILQPMFVESSTVWNCDTEEIDNDDDVKHLTEFACKIDDEWATNVDILDLIINM
ncbi:Aste57867_10092 [Aphanomyces stellatus]|uniref:Aste57867_10092 protein n=1 Tax=Aphanomyces stellatus TaxID=120398 RepID=A0A485KQ54_9STRA|nr:hypothetical protein As57867_010053 [Aphanomyces stellatus]VFT86968.1 Aste57867_10092 [Aphanomyces stellatus]